MRRNATILAIALFGSAVHAQRPDPYSAVAKRYDFEITKNIMIPMRDGISLAADVYRPKGAGEKLPVILMRTPYNKDTYGGSTRPAKFFAEQGYVVVSQDVRGQFHSDGRYAVQMADMNDGYDSIDWASKQPWSTGKVGTYGCSYLGEVQYLSLKTRHPAHAAAIPQAASGAVGPAGGFYKNFGAYDGGAFLLSTGFGWFGYAGHKDKDGAAPKSLDFVTLLRTLPTIEMAKRAGYARSDWEDFISHPPGDAYWDQMHYLRDDDRFDTPTLQVNSWFDVTPDATLHAFNLMRRNAVSAKARENQFVIISPTEHCASEFATEHTTVGAMDFGDARYPYAKLYLDWFDHWLKGADNGVEKRAKVQYYLMGKNEWRTSATWPVAGMRATPYFLSNVGAARTITTERSNRAAADSFVYDPADPFPSRGGTICCTGNPKDLPGVFDQADLETRPDVLVYSTPPLAAPLTIAGPVKLVLWVSSDAKDTDFSAKLLDVDEQGHAWNLLNGVLRARYREGFGKQVLMQKGGVYKVEVNLKATAYQFAPGHRVRLYVSSSDFPLYDRNLNTGGDNARDTTWVKATNTIHYGGLRGSQLLLPVVK